jgi:hypothetical protein
MRLHTCSVTNYGAYGERDQFRQARRIKRISFHQAGGSVGNLPGIYHSTTYLNRGREAASTARSSEVCPATPMVTAVRGHSAVVCNLSGRARHVSGCEHEADGGRCATRLVVRCSLQQGTFFFVVDRVRHPWQLAAGHARIPCRTASAQSPAPRAGGLRLRGCCEA